MFDWLKPMVQLLCCSESWGQYHLAIFKRAILKIEKVILQIRDARL